MTDHLKDERAALAPDEQAKADRDLLLYGESFILDGKHIPVECIKVLRATQSESDAALAEEAHVAKRMSETLAEVYLTILGDDAPDEEGTAIDKVLKAAQVLRIEVDLYRAQGAQPLQAQAAEAIHVLVQRHANAARALENMYTEKNVERLKAISGELEAVLTTPPASQVANNETVSKWIYDNVVATLAPAWDYIQTHQEQFNARAGDDKTAIIVSQFMRAMQAPAVSEEAAQVLKGIGKINGDGWKDATRKGEVVFVWNAELPRPYKAGQYPRIGCEEWSASTEQYDFVPATVDEARSALSSSHPTARAEGGAAWALQHEASMLVARLRLNGFSICQDAADFIERLGAARAEGGETVEQVLEAQEALYHPATKVFFRAGLLACREYMARFVAHESPTIAASIRASWWPSLGEDFGPPRKLVWSELTEGEYGEEGFRARSADEISPTQEALPIALGFLQSIDPTYGRATIGTEGLERSLQREVVAAHDAQPEAVTALQAEIDRLNAIINTPHANDFLRAVSIEAEHQRQRWGAEGDAGKAPADWFWIVGYLAGKALHAHAAGNVEKAEHHIITTAAALDNWHLHLFGRTSMRPGVESEKAAGFDAPARDAQAGKEIE